MSKEKLKAAEDNVSLFLSGGECHKTHHDPASLLEKLIMWRMLVLEFPHLSRNLIEIQQEIRQALKT
jgi:hypothetical protein